MNEMELLADADRRARAYVAGIADRRVYPDDAALIDLVAFDEPLPESGSGPERTLALLDDIGTPGTVASNGPNYLALSSAPPCRRRPWSK
jgi:hypothetical protein